MGQGPTGRETSELSTGDDSVPGKGADGCPRDSLSERVDSPAFLPD